MSITVKKTFDLADKDWEELASGFNETFQKESNILALRQHYQANEFGYTLHAIARNEEGKFIGHTSVIPHYYLIDDQKVKIGLSGSTFIMKDARSDIFLFKKMYDELKEFCRIEDILCIMGVPNNNSFKYAMKVLKKKHLKDLDYYVLPVHPFREKNFLNRVVGFTVSLNVYLQLFMSRMLNFKEDLRTVRILKTDLFMSNRLDEKYERFDNGESEGSYRIYEEDGQKVAYLMHFEENGIKSYRSLTILAREVIKKENPDLIIYIGTFKMKQLLLIKLPERFEPRKLPLTITLLGNGTAKIQNKLLDAENWDFGLLNFDVR